MQRVPRREKHWLSRKWGVPMPIHVVDVWIDTRMGEFHCLRQQRHFKGLGTWERSLSLRERETGRGAHEMEEDSSLHQRNIKASWLSVTTFLIMNLSLFSLLLIWHNPPAALSLRKQLFLPWRGFLLQQIASMTPVHDPNFEPNAAAINLFCWTPAVLTNPGALLHPGKLWNKSIKSHHSTNKSCISGGNTSFNGAQAERQWKCWLLAHDSPHGEMLLADGLNMTLGWPCSIIRSDATTGRKHWGLPRQQESVMMGDSTLSRCHGISIRQWAELDKNPPALCQAKHFHINRRINGQKWQASSSEAN